MPDEHPVRPIAAVSICVVRDGAALLIKRANPGAYGLWSLPGGKIELGEPVREAALRELKEETGVRAEIIRLLDCVDVIHRDPAGRVDAHFILSVFGAQWKRGMGRASSDASAVTWCTAGELDRYKMTPGTPELIRRAIPALTKN